MLCRLDSLKDCCQHIPCPASPHWWVLVGAVLPPVPHTNLKSSGPVVFIAGAGGNHLVRESSNPTKPHPVPGRVCPGQA